MHRNWPHSYAFSFLCGTFSWLQVDVSNVSFDGPTDVFCLLLRHVCTDFTAYRYQCGIQVIVFPKFSGPKRVSGTKEEKINVFVKSTDPLLDSESKILEKKMMMTPRHLVLEPATSVALAETY